MASSDVVVVIPGILGSVLEKDGREVWAPSAGAIARAIGTLGRSVADLAIAGDDSGVDDIGDGVMATRLVPDTHLVPGFWKVDGYSDFVRFLQRRLGLVPGENLFELAYDWRRSNRVTARRLAAQSQQWLKAWRTRHPDAKLILIAHSMGGLVSRYFLETLGGYRDTRLLITLGTPYGGSISALDSLVNGLRKRVAGLTLFDLSDFLRSLSSVHELAPTFPCVSVDGGELRRVSEVRTLPHIDWARLDKAAAFHAEIRAGVDERAAAGGGYRILPIVGDYQHTLQSATFIDNVLEPLATYKGRDTAGDGTVPQISAVPYEMEIGSGMMTKTCHAALQNGQEIRNQVVHAINGLELGKVITRSLGAPAGIGLQIDDLYAADEPIAGAVRSEDPSRDLRIAIETADRRQTVASMTLVQGDDEWTKFELPPQPPGVYRLRVSGEDLQPVEDVLMTNA